MEGKYGILILSAEEKQIHCRHMTKNMFKYIVESIPQSHKMSIEKPYFTIFSDTCTDFSPFFGGIYV